MLRNFLFLLLFILQSSLYAQERVSIVVLDANEAPPYLSKTLSNDGIIGEIVYALSKACGLNSEIVFKPLSRMIEDDTNNDLGNPAFFMANQDFAAIIPIALYHVSLYYYDSMHKDTFKFKSLNDLKGQKIGVLKGTLIDSSYFQQEGIHFEESYSHESLFKKLKLGRLDMVIEIDLVAQQTLKQLYPQEIDNFIQVDMMTASEPIAIMLANEYPDAKNIAKKYRQGLKKIIQNGTYEKILSKYYLKGTLPDGWFKELERFEQLYKMDEE
ncbi:MAG: transporter substrate-binding domain-containing protein [Campylobacterales bacterium]|nr:transporter substrate-binding domain-containing protein [Campylobacterales bacterium]